MTRRGAGGARAGLRVLVVTNMWPTREDPAFGSFVEEQLRWIQRLARRGLLEGGEGLRIEIARIRGRGDRGAYARAIPRLRRRLRAGGHDLVHAHHVLAGLAAWLAGAGGDRTPFLLTHHGIEALEGWQAPLCAWLSPRADRVLVTSPALAARLRLPPEAVLPCGVDLHIFRPGDGHAARAELGLPEGPPRIAWVGADRPEKRLWLARAAVDALRESRPDAELLQVTGRPRAEVPIWLRAAHALLLSSTHEGSPMVLREALACGRPVVATDVGDARLRLAGLPGCSVHAEAPAPDLARRLAAGLEVALDAGPIDARARLWPLSAEASARRVWRAWRAAVDAAPSPR